MAGAAGCGGVTWAGADRAGRVCSQGDVRASHRIVPLSSPVTDGKMERVFTEGLPSHGQHDLRESLQHLDRQALDR